MEFIYSVVENPAYTPFVYALAILAIIAILEVLMGLLPDIDLDIDTEADVDVSFGVTVLDWLYIGKMPLLIILVVFLTSFSLIGFGVQSVLISRFGVSAPWWVSAFSFLASCVVLHFFGKWLSGYFITEENAAASDDEFEGKIARITMGDANKDKFAQAILQHNGKDYHVSVKPMDETRTYKEGVNVVLVEKDKDDSSIFRCALMEDL